MKLNILVLSAGRRVELIRSFKDSLNKQCVGGQVFAADNNPSLSAACNEADRSFVVPRASSEEYITEILHICIEHGIGLVVPTIDTELCILSTSYYRFKEKGIELVISSTDLVEACRDKRLSKVIFNTIGLRYPDIYNHKEIKVPCFCKPYFGSSSIGAFPIHNPEQLTDKIAADPANMFMELIGSDYVEYTVDAYFDKGGALKGCVPRERLEVRSGEVSKGITRKDFAYVSLVNGLHNLKGARGCITVQVFVNKGNETLVGLEINPRFGGGYPLTEAAGASFTEWLIKEYLLGGALEWFDSWDENLLMLRYDAKVLVHAP